MLNQFLKLLFRKSLFIIITIIEKYYLLLEGFAH